VQQEFLPITLISRGDEVTNCRYYPAKGSKKGVIFVGGIGGNFDSPAKNLYPKLSVRLYNEGIGALRVQFRYPTDLMESVQDVLTGAEFLQSEGANTLGLVGHSFGGAVVIQAGTKLQSVKTVITLATQGFGADVVPDLASHASILLIHGAKDETLSVKNSILVYRLAEGHKKIKVLKGNRHGLDESAEEVYSVAHEWLTEELSRNC
jgi:alpha/beta superfamily hydrolase